MQKIWRVLCLAQEQADELSEMLDVVVAHQGGVANLATHEGCRMQSV